MVSFYNFFSCTKTFFWVFTVFFFAEAIFFFLHNFFLASKPCENFFLQCKGAILEPIPEHPDFIVEQKVNIKTPGAILQPIPEHPKRDFIFCLSTAFGDAYLFQVRMIILIWWSSIIMIMMMIITSSRWKLQKMLMIVIYDSIVSYHYCYLAIPTFSRWKYWR